MEGRIIKNISNDYYVKSDCNTYICKARGLFRNEKIIPLVGDIVEFDEKKKYIEKIKSRKNYLIRPSLANIDQLIIVTSVKNPSLDTNLLDKLLTISSYNNIKPIICFTKLDLLEEKEIKEVNTYLKYYEQIGYKVITNENKFKFKKILKDKLTVFTGQSGAGKSTLLNLLDETLNLKTNEISLSLGRGKHTTRHIELYEIYDGLVADTPGFSSLDFDNMTKFDIRDNMNEMFDCIKKCEYRDCMHLNEKNCEVKRRLENGQILKSRYQNYIKFIEKR